MARRKSFNGAITLPDGRECSVVYTQHSSGTCGSLTIKDAAGLVVYNGSGESQSDAVFNFYNWLRDGVESVQRS